MCAHDGEVRFSVSGPETDEDEGAASEGMREQWKDGHFTAPHGAAADSEGHVYVMDWNFLGRMTRLERLADEEPAGPPDVSYEVPTTLR